MYQFRVRMSNGSRLELRLGWIWRLFFVVCAVLIASAAAGDEQLRIVPSFLALVCVAAALFDERWDFDRADGKVTMRVGFFPLMRRRVYDLQQVHAVELRGSHRAGAEAPGAAAAEAAVPTEDRYRRPGGRSMMHRGLIRLSIRLQRPDGSRESVNLQTEAYRRVIRLQELGRTIADFCAVPFESSI